MTDSQFNKDYIALASTLYRIAFYILESETEAQDTVQELYLRLWEKRGMLDEINSPKAYSIRTLKNLCLDRMRRQHLTFPEEIPDEGQTPTVDEEIDARRRLDKVLEAVKSLPERQRQILILRTIEGLSYDEIARRTGMNGLTCRVLISRARSKLKAII